MTSKKRIELLRLKLDLDKDLQDLYNKKKIIQKSVIDHENLDYTNTDLDYNAVLIRRRLKELGWV